MNARTVESMQFTTALAALKRIRRKKAGFVHANDPRNTCNCPQCIAKDALDTIDDLEELRQ